MFSSLRIHVLQWRLIVACVLTCSVYGQVFAAQTAQEQSFSDLPYSVDQLGIFDAGEIIQLELTAALSEVFADRDEEVEEYPASLVYHAPSGEPTVQDIQVKLRGNFRKKEAHCGFPPLRLNFQKKQTAGTIFEGLDKVKLVTHCQDWRKVHNQLVLLEYLAYKMYNEITPLSFQVRLASITYVDEDKKRDPVTRYGFIIEDDDELAKRNGGEIVKRAVFHQDSTDYDQITQLSLFQFMIGNTDWSVPALHNIRLVSEAGNEKLRPVPYDFDFSGFVSAPYATPPKNLPISDVKTRLFRGYCRSAEELKPHLDIFKEREADIKALIDDLEPLQKKYRKQSRNYINQFYKVINSEKRTRKQILKSCRRDR